MARNIELDAMDGGAIVATEELSDGTHAELIKLAVSDDGERTLIPADAVKGLKVDAGGRGLNTTQGLETVNNVTPVPSVSGSGYIAEDPTRRSLIIQNVSTKEIWVSGNNAGGDYHGIRLGPNETLVADNSAAAAWYLWSPDAGVQIPWLAEVD